MSLDFLQCTCVFNNVINVRAAHPVQVMENLEIYEFHSRPGRSWNLIVSPWISWKIKVVLDKFLQTVAARTILDAIVRSFWWTPEAYLCEFGENFGQHESHFSQCARACTAKISSNVAQVSRWQASVRLNWLRSKQWKFWKLIFH